MVAVALAVGVVAGWFAAGAWGGGKYGNVEVCKYGNMEYFNSYEEAVDDFMDFIGSDVYTGDPEDDKEVHRWYILDDTNLGTSSY